MLKHLHIANYAIIEDISIDFSGGLNIITGETGAGKSILMGALGLVLGDRADSSALWQKSKKCLIEAEFISDRPRVLAFLDEQDLDRSPGGEVLIRREITSNGKSRAFINDTPVNLGQLKAFASLLVDLHRQFDVLELGDHDFQREVIDALANHIPILKSYREKYKKWIDARKDLEEMRSVQANSNKELDYNRFLFDELEEAGLTENELENLEQEIRLQSHAEEIKSVLTSIVEELHSGDQPLVQKVKSYANQLDHITSFHPGIEAIKARMHGVQVELQDIAEELSRIGDSVKIDPAKLELANERMSLGYRLLKKHGVSITNELLDIKQALLKKLDLVLDLEEKITKAEKDVEEYYSAVVDIAKKITKGRTEQVKPFEEKVNKLLARIGMPNAKIKVELQTTEPGINGAENPAFLFDANKTGRFEHLHKVASGGELSRLMLSIKSLVATSVQLPTLIFDEIDTGISGEAARQVGTIMKELSSSHQLIAITHQAQIAAKADAHYFVYKSSIENKIQTSIRVLEGDERIIAIAKMLSGEKPSAAAMENAREMIHH